MTRQAAVIGTPISHSRSPAIFGFVAERSGLKDFEYAAREVLPEALPAFLAEVRKTPSYVGLNVTIPHKETAFKLMDELSEETRAIGAINVVRARDGRLQGFNTDVIGIQRTLEDEACDVAGQDCLILGSGGAARAVAYVLGKLGARTVFIWNRRPASAEALAARFGALFSSTTFVASDFRSPPPRLRLVVNATPAGMKGVEPEAGFFAPLAELPIDRGALAFDLIYEPAHTPFLAAARERGLRTAGGLRMLVDQALATWELWLGPLENRAVLRSGLLEHLRSQRPIFLTGFMGVGKSSIGASLARGLGWKHIDSDRAIEARAGLAIREIFARSGEEEFRLLEKQEIARLAATPGTVVSLGGGALMDPDTLALVQRTGELVYLSAELGTLEERIGASADRPLLAGMTPEARREKIREMLAAREPIYRKARLRVSTDGRSPTDVAEELVRRIREPAK